jgi:hypothetical protein
LTRPAIDYPFKSEIKASPPETINKFLAFTCSSIADLKARLKVEQQYNENFAYAYSSLRASPLVRMAYQGKDAIVCPLMTLLFWRFTGGLYYELISDRRFPNEFGDGFQNYVGEVIARACPNMSLIAEQEYEAGKLRKRTIDWIISEGKVALFLECKAKRISWGAKVSLNDLAPLENDIANMAEAVVQIYKTVADHQENRYLALPAEDDRKLYLAVVTPETGGCLVRSCLKKLEEAVTSKLLAAGLPADLPQSFLIQFGQLRNWKKHSKS